MIVEIIDKKEKVFDDQSDRLDVKDKTRKENQEMENGITPVMPVGGSDGMWGGNGFMGIFGLLILLGILNGGFGGFGGGNQQFATRDQVQNGFDTQNMINQTSGILAAVNSGTAQAVAATNQSFHDSLAAMQGLYNETARDIAALAVGQANLLATQNNCCCETKQMIMQSNYDSAMRDAATNANFTAQIQGVKDMMAQDKIEALQAQVSQLQLQAATSNTLKWPNSWTYTGGYFPPLQPSTPAA